MGDEIVVQIKRNDLQPFVYFHFTDDADADIDLTGATIRVTMKDKLLDTLKIDRQTAGIKFDGTASGSDADDIAAGKGHYEWQANETNVAGLYYMEFEATPSAGGKFTLPVRKRLVVEILPDLDGV